MTLQEFKKAAKDLMVANGLKRNDISITSPSWLYVTINCPKEQFSALHDAIENLAGFKNNSDIHTDYFDYEVNVTNKYNTNFPGILIQRAG